MAKPPGLPPNPAKDADGIRVLLRQLEQMSSVSEGSEPPQPASATTANAHSTESVAHLRSAPSLHPTAETDRAPREAYGSRWTWPLLMAAVAMASVVSAVIGWQIVETGLSRREPGTRVVASLPVAVEPAPLSRSAAATVTAASIAPGSIELVVRPPAIADPLPAPSPDRVPLPAVRAPPLESRAALPAPPTEGPAPIGQSAPRAPAVTGKLDAEKRAKLIARGQQLMAIGNIGAARLWFEQPAEDGDAEAAMLLAGTYDPVHLLRLGVRGMSGDKVLAIRWYRRAADLGATGAPARLNALDAR